MTTDVGQHQMWVAQAYPVRRPRGLLTSGGLGTMGFGLPAAIGAALAMPGRRVACVSGDGSILMNIQELATLAELDLPVAVLVFNNAQLGLVRQQQELFYSRRYEASRFGSAPDFAALARAFGIRGERLDPDGDPLAELASILASPGPCVDRHSDTRGRQRPADGAPGRRKPEHDPRTRLPLPCLTRSSIRKRPPP